jgi:tRNA A-37 threonylcarbamoyl transferase component Bud32
VKKVLAEDWQDILAFNQLDSFEALWTLDIEWFEPPNFRRGGWSGASRFVLKRPDGGEVGVFIKRQQNHKGASLRHPIKGEPTFGIEMRNILRLQKIGVPSLTPIYYEQRKQGGDLQAILMTKELQGYEPLDVLLQKWGQSGWPALSAGRAELISQMAKAIALLHQHRFQHHGLYTKHVFVQWNSGAPKICLIDLEKMRGNFNAKLAMRRDLYTFFKDFGVHRLTDQMRFLLQYLGDARLTPAAKRIWKELHNKARKKQAHLFKT